MSQTIFFAHLKPHSTEPALAFTVAGVRCLPAEAKVDVGGVKFKIVRSEYEPARDRFSVHCLPDSASYSALSSAEISVLTEQAKKEGWVEVLIELP